MHNAILFIITVGLAHAYHTSSTGPAQLAAAQCAGRPAATVTSCNQAAVKPAAATPTIIMQAQ